MEGGSENEMQGLQKPECPRDGASCVLHEMGDMAGRAGLSGNMIYHRYLIVSQL